ncbi:MAG TPA: DUF1326 domain-containing protein, partial [Planctomycetota bacterium]|nr:DUF1326 domain-containing protein [Planctomycetota bacterium]
MNLSNKLALLALAPLSLVAVKAWVCPGSCPFGTCGASNPFGPEAAAESSVVSRSSAITGRYVEARSASVYAGACHYGAESTTAGREAVLAWQLDGGSYEGFPLDGVELVAAVSADGNLAERDAARTSVVYLDEDLPMPKRAAALAWLKREQGAALGTIKTVRTGPVEVACDGDAYHVRAGDWVRLDGQAMPDRACCTMPSNVWYKPMVAIEGRLVGESALFAVDDPELGPPFERRAENDAFLGLLAAPAPACAATRSSRPL